VWKCANYILKLALPCWLCIFQTYLHSVWWPIRFLLFLWHGWKKTLLSGAWGWIIFFLYLFDFLYCLSYFNWLAQPRCFCAIIELEVSYKSSYETIAYNICWVFYLLLLFDLNFSIKTLVKCVPGNYLFRGLFKLWINQVALMTWLN
jgi:hypothetical protein